MTSYELVPTGWHMIGINETIQAGDKCSRGKPYWADCSDSIGSTPADEVIRLKDSFFVIRKDQAPDEEADTTKRIVWEERVHQANRLLREVCTENYPVTNIDVQVKNEMDQIRCRLDRIAFAIRYPKQAVKNKTLDR